MSPAAIFQASGSHFIVEKLHDELVVFDRRTNKAHLLDPRAAAIYRAARGGCSMDDLVSLVGPGTLEEKRALAELGVGELQRAGLVLRSDEAPSRRGLLKTLGAAAALPMVVSILAPTPAAAATVGAPCTNNADCSPLVCSGCLTSTPGTCQLCLPPGTDLTLLGGCPSMTMGTHCLCCSGECDDPVLPGPPDVCT